MLVLSRKPGENIIIGNPPAHIVVTVVSLDRGGTVRLGVKAPPEVRVDREEVFRRRSIPSSVPAKDLSLS